MGENPALDHMNSLEANLWRTHNALKHAKAELASTKAALATAKAGAVRWTTYDGTPETLPEAGDTVLLASGPTGQPLVVYSRHISPDSFTWCFLEFGLLNCAIEIGDQWAYLPQPPEVVK